MEPYEQDIQWLLAKRPSSTEIEQYAFSDKVAELIVDLGIDEDEAREHVLEMLEEGELSVS
jgi:hypothetical protein